MIQKNKKTMIQWIKETMKQPYLPEKNRVSRPRMFSAANSHASELLHVPSGWHDNVLWQNGMVDKMVDMLTMTIVHNSEVF